MKTLVQGGVSWKKWRKETRKVSDVIAGISVEMLSKVHLQTR